MNCSLPSMETALVEKLQRTYMLAAMWKKEKWLKVERSIGEQRVSEGRHTVTDVGLHCVRVAASLINSGLIQFFQLH